MPRLHALLALAFCLAAAARAEPPPAGHLAELFTSQGCSSCPPAEALFSELAEEDGLVTIEWHVDYWNALRHGGSSWADPYSSPDFTERQRAYNSALRGTRSVYTPQAVFAGRGEFTGFDREGLEGARKIAPPPAVRFSFADGRLTVSGKGEGRVHVVRLLPDHTTRVKGGENKGRTLKGRNIALSKDDLGRFAGKPASFDLPELGPGETCAVFVQAANLGPVLGAAYCPG